MRAVLSEQAVARMGRWGCGLLSQARALEGGWKVASGWMEGMVDAGVEVVLLGHWGVESDCQCDCGLTCNMIKSVSRSIG
jgi:hypothetical protein